MKGHAGNSNVEGSPTLSRFHRVFALIFHLEMTVSCFFFLVTFINPPRLKIYHDIFLKFLDIIDVAASYAHHDLR